MIFPSQKQVHEKLTHIFNVFTKSDAHIRPHFHLTGPSGSGKSFLVNQLAQEMKIPFLEMNAASLTGEGLSGNSLSKALRKLREHWNTPNIIFVDEFDKLFLRNGETTEGFRSMVQDEFLTALESKHTSIFTDYGKYEPIRIDNSLFIFAGAYSNHSITKMAELRDAGLRTEFIGRVPLILTTKEVPISEIRNCIKETTLFNYYMLMFPDTNRVDAIKKISNMLTAQQKELSIGIRLLNSIIHQYFMGALK